MLGPTLNILVLALTIAGSMLFMAVLNRVWPQEKRQVHNDLIGWQLNIIGTTYAVILGFMLYTVWTDSVAANPLSPVQRNARAPLSVATVENWMNGFAAIAGCSSARKTSVPL